MRIPAYLASCARPMTFFALLGLSLALISHLQKSLGYKTEQPMKEKSIILMAEGSEAALNRSQFKQETTNDLLGGQISFEEAVERFRETNLSSTEGMDNLRLMIEGHTDEERLVNQLMKYVKSTVDGFPGRYKNRLKEIEKKAQTYMHTVL